MTFPIILVNSATGSDTAASGAGPSTALTGTSNASTDATGLIVTLGGSPSLAAVATDGTHCIFLDDSTAGARNFGRITAKDDTAKTVTVDVAFRASASGLSWAIGGVRASINGTTSSKLTSNNSAAGDAMPGWTLRLQSGHTESGGVITMRRAGTAAFPGGYITLEGDPNAATMPVYTSSATGVAMNAALQVVRGIAFRKSGTPGSVGVAANANGIVSNVRILSNGAVLFNVGITANAVNGVTIRNCYIEQVGQIGIQASGEGARIENNLISTSGTHGIELSQTNRQATVLGNIIRNAASDGIRVVNTNTSPPLQNLKIQNNTIHNCTGDGIEITSSSTQVASLVTLEISNNQITRNGGFGINFSGASVTDALLFACNATVCNNNFGSAGSSTNNTSGECNLTLTLTGVNNVAVDPGYTDATNSDFSINTNTRALGFPLTAIGSAIVSGNRSYIDIGALQRQEPTGSGGGGGVSIGRLISGGV